MRIRRASPGRLVLTTACHILSAFLLSQSAVHAQCVDCDGDGFTFPTDCDDGAADIFPGQTEICNGLDDDCDGDVDEAAGCLRSCPFPDAMAPPLPSPDVGRARDAAWSGGMVGVANSFRSSGNPDQIRLTRMTAAGSPLGHTILGPGSFRPSVVWAGDAFAVAWARTASVINHLMLARVDASGALLAPPVIWRDCGGSDPALCRFPRLAWNGERYGVIWNDQNSFSVWFSALDRDGNLMPGTTVQLSDAATFRSLRVLTGIAASTTEFVAVWEEGLSVHLRRISPEGSLLGTETVIPDGFEPRVVRAGNGWGVAFRRRIPANPQGGIVERIYLAVVDAAGGVVAGPTEATMPTTVSGLDAPVDLVWTGAEFGVAWDGFDGEWIPSIDAAFLSRFDAGANLIQTHHLSLYRAHAREPEVVWMGSRYVGIWTPGGTTGHVGPLLCDCSTDNDGDGSSSCSDCDDADPEVISYGEKLCDGINNNCYSGNFPFIQQTEEWDDDGDGWTECEGDCNDARTQVRPGAPQLCGDLTNNDCDDPAWPSLAGTNEADDDGDSYTECEGDCDDAAGSVHPFGLSVCDGLNNNCSDPGWPALAGTEDEPGGICEFTGGAIPVISLIVDGAGDLAWQSDVAFPAWNVYRGLHSGLQCDLINYCASGPCLSPSCRPAGGWIQAPGSSPVTAQACGVAATALADAVALDPGQVAIYLVTGVTPSGAEGGLGNWNDVSGLDGPRLTGPDACSASN